MVDSEQHKQCFTEANDKPACGPERVNTADGSKAKPDDTTKIIIHSVEAAKYAARLLSKVHSKLLHKFDADALTADEVCHAYLL